jgi:antitoxin MazE
MMKVVVRKWGDSGSVRIPASVMAAAKIGLNQTVDMRAERGRIVVEPIRPQDYDIAELIEGITRDNRHEEIDFGPPTGKETLSRRRHAFRRPASSGHEQSGRLKATRKAQATAGELAEIRAKLRALVG